MSLRREARYRNAFSQVVNLFDPHLTRVIMFQSATGAKTTGGNGEDDGAKNGEILCVEGAVDEDAVAPRSSAGGVRHGDQPGTMRMV